MYFVESESVQPICFYEFDRYIQVMKERFSHTWLYRIVISCEQGFSRVYDVCMQTRLATDVMVPVDIMATQ